MIRVTKQGDNYIHPWFKEELKLISPNLSAFWDPRYERFLIISPAPINTFRNGYIVEYLVEKDGQYAPLDRRVLEALQRARYEKLRFASLNDFLVQSRQLVLDGSGRLAQVKTGGSLQTHDLKSAYFKKEPTLFLRDDRKLESYDATTGKGNDAQILTVENDTEIKLTAAVDLTADDYLFNVKAHADSELNGLGEMMGLCGIISAANPPYPNAANGLQGLKVADYPAWKAFVFHNNGVAQPLVEDMWIQVLNKVERYAKVDVILVSEGVFRSWYALLSSYKNFSNQKTMWGGWTGLPFYYHGREIPVVSDYFVPDGYAMFISNSNLILHVLTPSIVTWERGAAGGGILQKVPRMNQFVAEGHIFANLGTGLRRGFGLRKDIQEPSSN
ncbi:hypothetical protein ES705_47817 [subsurface metagenome]